MTWTEWAPGIAQFRGYKRAWLRGDLLAGLTVAAYLIPQVMAYATLAGLPPIAGLWTAMAPLLIYALLGSSRHLSVGPESTTALMVVAVLAPFAAGDASRYAALAAVLGVLVGAICFVAGIARLGFLANLLSRPVLVGYMAGVALVMIASQLGKLTGASWLGDEFVDQMRSFARGMGDLHWPTMLLAGAVLAPPGAGPLGANGSRPAHCRGARRRGGGGVVAGIQRDRCGRICSIRSARHPPCRLFAKRVGGVGDSGGRIAIVAFSDNILTARIFASRHGYEIDANAELRAIGVCNLQPASLAVSRSAPAAAEPRSVTQSEAARSSTRWWPWRRCLWSCCSRPICWHTSRPRRWGRWSSTPHCDSSISLNSVDWHVSAVANWLLRC